LIKTKKLILGLGNEILTDDSIGIRLANDLIETELQKLATIETASCGGMEILERIIGFDRVVIIDSIHSSSSLPGDIYLLTPSDFKITSHVSNMHDAGFLQALELGNELGFKIPAEIHIVAIGVCNERKFGTGLSTALEKKYRVIFERVFSEVKKLIL